MKKRFLIPLLLVLSLALVNVISHEVGNDNKESFQTEAQTITKADIALIELAVETEIMNEVTAPTDTTITTPLQEEAQTADITLSESTDETEIVNEVTAPTDTMNTKPLQEEATGTNNEMITISENELVFGEVSIPQIGGSIDHTFSTEELKKFVDTFNNFNIGEADCLKPSGTHTASESPITVILHFNNGKTMIFMAFEDGETYVTNENDNSNYALINKNLSEYIMELNKLLFVQP